VITADDDGGARNGHRTSPFPAGAVFGSVLATVARVPLTGGPMVFCPHADVLPEGAQAGEAGRHGRWWLALGGIVSLLRAPALALGTAVAWAGPA